jgi:hypothetical protein
VARIAKGTSKSPLLKAELARLKQAQAVIEREGFTDDRPLVEQFEELRRKCNSSSEIAQGL